MINRHLRSAPTIGFIRAKPPAVKRRRDETPIKPYPSVKRAFCSNFAGIGILIKSLFQFRYEPGSVGDETRNGLMAKTADNCRIGLRDFECAGCRATRGRAVGSTLTSSVSFVNASSRPSGLGTRRKTNGAPSMRTQRSPKAVDKEEVLALAPQQLSHGDSRVRICGTRTWCRSFRDRPGIATSSCPRRPDRHQRISGRPREPDFLVSRNLAQSLINRTRFSKRSPRR